MSWMRGVGVWAAVAVAVTLAWGCIDRPVAALEPGTNNQYVAPVQQSAVDKIDLLFMIDNSASMADKQAILSDAVPVLVRRLVTPRCLDESERPVGVDADGNGVCPAGSQPEFSPIKDIHIAIITSSLGAHGGEWCDPTETSSNPRMDDRARPIGKVRPEAHLSSWNDSGFLAWDPDAARGRARNLPPGESVVDRVEPPGLIQQFQNMLEATGEDGCGFEASLESWYRFLVDPEPPSAVGSTNDELGRRRTVATFSPRDQSLLELRAKFLRPDSLVAIVMLTDENDCSVVDSGSGWLVGLRSHAVPRATSRCDTDPNDRCCTSCGLKPPDGCAPDPACNDAATGLAASIDELNDGHNLRCYNQKQRFGVDLLQPIQRYVDGLTQPTLVRDPRAVAADAVNKQTVIQNPLFAGGKRDASLIFLAGIVGVPWQDVASKESWSPEGALTYLSYEELEAEHRFDWILGPEAGGPPSDALMIETPVDRTTLSGLAQVHPGTGHALAPSGTGPASNPINGKESSIVQADGIDDLQYACVFDLDEPVECTAGVDCDCNPEDQKYNRALCQGTKQVKAKAYPGIRELQVLRSFGEHPPGNAIIASICPKLTDKRLRDDPSYGYTPAVSAIIERLKVRLRGKCLPRPLASCNCDSDLPENAGCTRPGQIACHGSFEPGQVSCSVIEARVRAPGGACPASCVDAVTLPGRLNPQPGIEGPVFRQLQELDYCGGPNQRACAESYCLCEIQQFRGEDLKRCQRERALSNLYGYCYVDPELARTEMRRVASCRAARRRSNASSSLPARICPRRTPWR